MAGKTHNRGVVMIIALIGLVVLAALLLWVINLGQQVNHRVTTQNAADASAQAAASWTARSLNTIAYNNVEMARLIAAINVLDAMPQAVDYTHREDVALRDALDAQLARGFGGSPKILVDTVQQYYGELQLALTEDIEDLVPVDELFKQVDVAEMTVYANDGHLWRALTAMDEMNAQVAYNLGVFANIAATRAGELNLGSLAEADKDGRGAGALPQLIEVPTRRGTFNDFLLPVLRGMLPTDVDDPIVRRGPWDAVFGWRNIHYVNVPGSEGTPGSGGSRNVVSGGRPGNPLSRREGSNGSGGSGPDREPVAYRTWGPYDALMAHMSGFANSNHDTVIHPNGGPNLSYYLTRVADRKVNYLWPGSRPNRSVVDPDWRTSYDEARAIAQAGTPRIYETAFYVVEIKSIHPADDSRFMTPGTWSLASEDNQDNPRVHMVSRWQDPASWGIQKVGSHVWRDEWDYEVYWDASIGIVGERDAAGEWVPQPVYRIDHIAFAGVNVGEPEDVRNPHEGFNALASGSPAPMNLDHATVPHDNLDARWHHLSMLGIATRDDKPQGWTDRFQGGRPQPMIVAIAQAKVFNNHSWDLWTPMWRAELEPVSRYEQWMDRFDAPSDPRVGSAQNPQLLAAIRTYLTNARELAEAMLTH